MNIVIDSIYGNMNANGGGLAVNITGKYESNRHAIARMEKVTFGEAVKFLKTKKGGALQISATQLLDAWWRVKGEPEWHHAGFLPKQYGGGMKKTYFLDEQPTTAEVVAVLKKSSRKLVASLKKAAEEQTREERRRAFITEFGKPFSRVTSTPEHSVTTRNEMNGRYGWFEAQSQYNLTVYYSGYSFESAEKRAEYFAI